MRVIGFRGGVVGGPKMEGGAGIWEQLKGKVLGRSLLSKVKGRGGEEEWGVGKHDKWMLESQIQGEGGQERGWVDGLVSPIGSPGPG